MSPPASTLPVVLLWHMHQPYYVDPQTQVAVMPWVRLHAVKGYNDMIDMADRFPELRLNFNFTPVLVRQIRELAERQVTDQWETWARTPAPELNHEQRYALLENFFKINHETCIRPYPRYAELLDLRGPATHAEALNESVRLWTEKDFRDLQVWYNLAWCGFSACRAYPELVELKRKGRHFTEEEKNRLLDIHHEVLSQVLDRYRAAIADHRVELTTTPFYHPIMPLVYDTDFGKRAMPDREFPPRLQAPEDVAAHLRLAQEEHERAFGVRARGLWPSEGSVAPELIPLFQEAGIEYFCTDEDILFRSLPGGTNHVELFQAWEVEHEGAQVGALFRERPLSDFIGFNAARNSAADAADHLCHHLEHLAEVVGHPQRVVTLALDGENAWEAFLDGGEEFLEAFYRRLVESKHLHSRRLGDIFAEAESCPKVEHLHTGSWISANFDIWIGEAEENRGWGWILETREFLLKQENGGHADPEKLAAAWQEIYAAEGSDWFWWYGPDFQNDSDLLFDGLFRKHLQNVYLVLGQEPPPHLDEPIRKHGQAQPVTPPYRWIEPPEDVDQIGFFDWLGAGSFDVRQQQTAMFQSGRIVEAIYFGFSRERFYFRVDFEEGDLDAVYIDWKEPESLALEMVPAEDGWMVRSPDPAAGKIHCWGKDRLMLSVPLEHLGLDLEGSASAAFEIRVLRKGVEAERYPEHGKIEFQGPGPEFHQRNWFV